MERWPRCGPDKACARLQRVRYAWSTAARRLGEVGARAMRRARMERKVGLRWERPGVVQAFGFVLFRRLGGWVCG